VVLLSASGTDGFAFGVVVNEPTAARVAGGSLLGGRGAGQPPERRSPTGWTTGGRTLDDALSPHRQVRDASLAVFAHHPIFAGGPDGTANVTMLHPHSHVRGCVEVRPGLCYGGDLAHAAELVRTGDASADDFVFFKGRVDFGLANLRASSSLASGRARPRQGCHTRGRHPVSMPAAISGQRARRARRARARRKRRRGSDSHSSDTGAGHAS